MPRLNERDRRSIIDAQIMALTDQAADPALNDRLGAVNILRAQLVAEMAEKHERIKAAWDAAMADLITVFHQRIQQLQA